MIYRALTSLVLQTAGGLTGCSDERARTGEVSRVPPQPQPPSDSDSPPDTGNITNDAEGEALLPEGEGESPVLVGEGEGVGEGEDERQCPTGYLEECAYVEPLDIDFGGVQVGESRRSNWAAIYNCGCAEAYVRSIRVEGSDSFTLDAVGPCAAGTQRCNLNTSIPFDGLFPFRLQYTPENEGPAGGRMWIDLKVSEELFQVNLFGRGVLDPPVAIASARVLGVGEFLEYNDPLWPLRVAAGDIVELKGSDSFNPFDTPLRYLWSVVDVPDRANIVFEPAETEPDVTALIARGGQHTFELSVENEAGLSASARVYLMGVVGSGLSIELSWQSVGGQQPKSC